MSFDPKNTKRRFIAGAVCPRCSEMDTIVMYRLEGIEHRECVSCDFAEQANFNAPVKELPTRVNQVESYTAVEELQVVKIIDPD